MASKKKKKRSPEEMHRQVQDALQYGVPYQVQQYRKEGRRFKAFLLQYVSAPMLRVMNRVMNFSRYRGKTGGARKQSEQMRRRVEQKQAAMRHLQANLPKSQRRRKI